MKKLILFVLCWLCFVPAARAAEPLKVVAAHRILEDWVKQVGGEHVSVQAIHNGKRDIHFFEPRPSHIKMVAQADAVVIAGLDLDAWMPELIAASRNPKVQYGRSGCIDPSVGVLVLDKPTGKVDMAQGDVHPYGNPHFYFHKDNVLKALDNICAGLCAIRPELCAEFEANCARYKKEVLQKFAQLRWEVSHFHHAAVVTYHASWDYFLLEFGLELLGQLEPKPGIPPSPSHLEKLTEAIKKRPFTVILAESYYPDKPLRSLAERTGVKVVRAPVLLGNRDGDKDFLDLLQKNADALTEALAETPQ